MQPQQSWKIALFLCASVLQALTSGAQLPAITNPASQTVWAGANVAFTVGVSGDGPFTYQWLLNSNNLPNGIITTVAGTGTNTYFGDGGPATNAGLNNPYGVLMDASGNVYIADSANQRIRKMSRNGIITTVAGNGTQGFSGDGGNAANASLSNPYGVALDASGNLFIADRGNSRIRKVDTNGIITTVAGKGGNGYTGDGYPALEAKLWFPGGVTVDASGNLFIADTDNGRIRKASTNGIISTIAGNGAFGYAGDGGAATNARLDRPQTVALDGSGNLFIADTLSETVRKVDTNGIITTVAGVGLQAGYTGDGGAATNANLNSPFGVAVGNCGNLFIADSGNGCIRNVDSNGIITTVAGYGTNSYSGDGGSATNASLNNPCRLAVDRSGNLFIADTFNNRIRKATPVQGPALPLSYLTALDAGDYQVIVTSSDGSVTSSVATLAVGTISIQPASRLNVAGTTATFAATVGGITPSSFQWLKNGVVLTDGGNISGSAASTLTLSNVQDPDAATYAVVISNNVAGSATSSPALLILVPELPASQAVWAGATVAFVPVFGTGRFAYQWQLNSTNLPNIITTVAGNGTEGYSGDGGAAINASVFVPRGVAVDTNGNLFIADTLNQRIRKVDTNGIITTAAGNGSTGYSGDGGAATNATFYTPTAVVLDVVGNLFIADSVNACIRKVDTNGIITTVAGNGTTGYSGDGGAAINASLNAPQIMTVDGSGNLFIADTLNQRVRKVDTNGIITTFAGNGATGYSGDGGQATNAGLHRPWGMVEDASGNLFIADTEDNRVRKVDTNGIITTVAGTGTLGYSGDGGPATNAMLHAPTCVVLDASGRLVFSRVLKNPFLTKKSCENPNKIEGQFSKTRLFQHPVSDFGNNRIRQVDANGIITTVACNGTQAYGGAGGPALNASLNDCYGVAADALGDLFIADSNNNRIRKVTNTQRAALALINVTAADTGNYQLVVTGPAGSVTVNFESLMVATSPLIYQTAFNSNGSFTLDSVNLPGSTNVVLCATNLSPPVVWQPLSTNLAGVNGDWQFTDTNAPNVQTIFYRFVMY